MKFLNIKNFLLLFSLLLIIACAQVVHPTGGPRDEIPPQAIKYIPDSAATNFKANRIIIAFNEYIQLRDVEGQVIISPPFKISPEIKVKGKMLHINVKDTLEPNTTYTINFGNALQDITENNVATNFQYIFSTGDFIDSLSVSGFVNSALDNTSVGGALVMLYKNHDDSVIYKRKPDYFTKTKEDGSFSINSIKAGTYKLVGLKDANANYLFDLPDELIGYSDTLIKVDEVKKVVQLKLFKEGLKKQFLKKYYSAGIGKLILVFNKPTDSLSFNALNSTEVKSLLEFNRTKDTLTYWIGKLEKDSLILQVKEGGTILDTAEFKLNNKPSTGRGGKAIRFALIASPYNTRSGSLLPEENITLELSHPIGKVNQNLIYLTNYNDTLKFELVADSIPRRYQLKYSFKEDSTYRLTILPGAYIDMFGLVNDTLINTFKVTSSESLGNLKFKLSPPFADSYILELINEKNTVVRSYSGSGEASLNWKYLMPGNYKLRLIVDRNKNQKWDTGNYINKEQPEKITFYPKPITVRANWEMELEWDAKEALLP